MVREFFGYHNVPATPENFERLFTKYVLCLDQIIKESVTQVCEGVAEFMAAARATPEPPVFGLLTGIDLGAEIKLRRVRLWDTFETGGFADDHEHRDEIAAIARERGARLLKRDLADDEVLVIGDTPLDIRCARAIKAKVLAVATGGAELEELEAHRPDWAVKDLSRLDARKVLE